MHIGNRIIRLQQVLSTNDVAWLHAGDPNCHGLVVLAEEQTAGRGRRGDPWLAPAGSSLLLSMLLHSPQRRTSSVMTTIWACVAVCLVLEKEIGLSPSIKWPNDVQVRGRKVCGILVEQRADWSVIGIGLNVNLPESWLHASLLNDATSLSIESGRTLDREHLFACLLKQCNDSMSELSNDTHDDLVSHWKRFSGIEGVHCRIKSAGGDLEGRIISLQVDQVIVEVNGRRVSLQPEQIHRISISA